MNILHNAKPSQIITTAENAPFFLVGSRFEQLRPLSALAILIGTVLLIGYGLLRGQEPLITKSAKSPTDVRLYKAIVQRLHNGESYYVVAGEELRTRGYATRPFINWRPPFLAWFLASLPNPSWGRWILMSIASVAWALWVILFYQAGNQRQTVAVALFLCVCIPIATIETGSYFHEHWVGILIFLTIALYGKNHSLLAVIIGSVALLLRELSLPFVLIMIGCALWEKKWLEASLWAIAMVIFTSFIFVHAHIINPLLTDMDHTNYWIRWGGWRFVLSTANWNPLLLTNGLAAIMLPLSLLGLIGWSGELGNRVKLTVIVYIVVFMIAGRTDNTYWGLVYSPLLPLGWVMVPSVLHDLWNAMRRVRFT